MIASIAIIGFLVAATLAGVRLLRGPSLADRMIALDVQLVCLMAALVTDAAATEDRLHLPLLVVIGIVGFTATVAVSRFIVREEPE